jgi:hypothetical protein
VSELIPLHKTSRDTTHTIARPNGLSRAPFYFCRCYIPKMLLLLKHGKNSPLRKGKRLTKGLISPWGQKRLKPLMKRFTFFKCIYFINHMLASQTSPQRHFADGDILGTHWRQLIYLPLLQDYPEGISIRCYLPLK